jgi:hypothetical protein
MQITAIIPFLLWLFLVPMLIAAHTGGERSDWAYGLLSWPGVYVLRRREKIRQRAK